MQNAEAAKDPLSDLISYNLLLAHRHFLVSRIIIMITDSDVPRHDRFHSCHSCGYPPRRCLFSKHITSLNIGGGRDGGGGWGVSRHQTLGCKISPQLCSSAVHTCETQEAGCSEHAVFKCFYSHALLDCVGCGGDSQSQVSNSCHLRHLGWGGREALDVRY